MSTQGQNGGAPPSEHHASVQAGDLERDTKQLLAAIERLSDDASRSLRDRVDRSPYGSLGLAFLGGYVLGGGLTFRIGTLILAAASRAVLASLVTRGTTVRGT